MRWVVRVSLLLEQANDETIPSNVWMAGLLTIEDVLERMIDKQIFDETGLEQPDTAGGEGGNRKGEQGKGTREGQASSGHCVVGKGRGAEIAEPGHGRA